MIPTKFVTGDDPWWKWYGRIFADIFALGSSGGLYLPFNRETKPASSWANPNILITVGTQYL